MEGILWITVTIAFFAFSIAHVRFRDFVLIEGMDITCHSACGPNSRASLLFRSRRGFLTEC